MDVLDGRPHAYTWHMAHGTAAPLGERTDRFVQHGACWCNAGSDADVVSLTTHGRWMPLACTPACRARRRRSRPSGSCLSASSACKPHCSPQRSKDRRTQRLMRLPLSQPPCRLQRQRQRQRCLGPVARTRRQRHMLLMAQRWQRWRRRSARRRSSSKTASQGGARWGRWCGVSTGTHATRCGRKCGAQHTS